MLAVFRSKVIEKLRALPIMDKIYSWPKTIIIALDHYVQFLMQECMQARPRHHS